MRVEIGTSPLGEKKEKVTKSRGSRRGEKSPRSRKSKWTSIRESVDFYKGLQGGDRVGGVAARLGHLEWYIQSKRT